MSVAPVRLTDHFGLGAAASAAVHAAAFALLDWLLVARLPAVQTVELDFSRVPRVAVPAAPRAVRRPAAKAWTAPVAGLAPAPTGATEAPEPAEAPPALPPCPPPCPAVAGDWLPAGRASAKPRWIAGFITDDDYPRLARQQGLDGTVVLSVLIDAAGKVREVRLLKGSYDALNQVALEKVRAAVFEPARDADGRPIPVDLRLPIRFELR